MSAPIPPTDHGLIARALIEGVAWWNELSAGAFGSLHTGSVRMRLEIDYHGLPRLDDAARVALRAAIGEEP